jgi:hypothetical protein
MARTKFFKINPKQREDILKKVDAGATYKSLAEKYGVSKQRIQQIAVVLGKPKNWKLIEREKHYLKVKPLVLKRLSEYPFIHEVLKEFGTTKDWFEREGITLRETKEYLEARSVCVVCGISLKTGYRWFGNRMCEACGRKRNAAFMRAHIMKRYRSDPEYRKKIQAYNREQHKKHRLKHLRARREARREKNNRS